MSCQLLPKRGTLQAYHSVRVAALPSQKNITVSRPLTGGRSTKNDRSSYDTPRPRLFSIVLWGRFAFWDVFIWRKVNNFSGLCCTVWKLLHFLFSGFQDSWERPLQESDFKKWLPSFFFKWPATQEHNVLKCFVRSNLVKPCVAKKPNIIPASTLQRRKALQYKQNAGILQ